MRNTTVIGQETNRALLIKLRDPGSLARSQGALASLAQGVAPATIEAKVYDGFRDEMNKSLKAKNIDAEVSIVEPKGFKMADGKHIWTDVGYAIGGAGVVGLLWFLFSARSHRR